MTMANRRRDITWALEESLWKTENNNNKQEQNTYIQTSLCKKKPTPINETTSHKMFCYS